MYKEWQKQENLILVNCIVNAINNNKNVKQGIKDFAIKFGIEEKEVLKHWENISEIYQVMIEKATNKKIETTQKNKEKIQCEKQEITIDSIIEFLQKNKNQISSSDYIDKLEQEIIEKDRKYQELKNKYDNLYKENKKLNITLTNIKKTLN